MYIFGYCDFCKFNDGGKRDIVGVDMIFFRFVSLNVDDVVM